MNNSPSIRIDPKVLFFHPITGCLAGFLVYHFVPPFFSEEGHDWLVIFLDILGIFFFAVGTTNGTILKRSIFGAASKIRIDKKDFTLLFLIFTLLIETTRIYMFASEGVTSLLHHYARQTVGIWPTMYSLLVGPYIILLWCGIIVLKKKYCYFFLALEFVCQLSIMSKAGVFFFFLYGMVVAVFFGALSKKSLKRWGVVLLTLLCFTIVFAKTIGNYRSYIEIGLAPPEDMKTEVSVYKSISFFMERLNIHRNSAVIRGYEEYIARKDLQGLSSILPKLLGFEKEYLVNPTTVSFDALIETGILSPEIARTATEFPRGVILYHMGGLPAVALFSALFGLLFGLIFTFFYQPDNLAFPVFFFLLDFGYLMGGTGSLIAAAAFQFLFTTIAYSIPLLLFFGLKALKKAMTSIVIANETPGSV